MYSYGSNSVEKELVYEGDRWGIYKTDGGIGVMGGSAF